jgi:multiple RNA-binding domain-containing protein 1
MMAFFTLSVVSSASLPKQCGKARRLEVQAPAGASQQKTKTAKVLLLLHKETLFYPAIPLHFYHAKMDSSRIFIKGLPPSITEADFKKHFSSGGREVTDARLFVNRRIGYVGYKTPEDAQSAVKYFNKTFVRMSRIGVEVARPIGEANPGRTSGRAPTAPRENQSMPIEAAKTHNDADKQAPEDDPKLKEYLEVMKPKSKKRTWENDDALQANNEAPAADDNQTTIDAGGASDDEYEVVPRKAKRTKVDPPPVEQQPAETTAGEVVTPPSDNAEDKSQQDVAPQGPVSDADWARSRTSRLLGLLDDDEEEEENSRPKARAASVSSSDMEDFAPTTSGPSEVVTSINTSAPAAAVDNTAQPNADAEPTGVRASMRLFVRNLPYDVQQEDLQSEFASYGNVEEVSNTIPSHSPPFKMST